MCIVCVVSSCRSLPPFFHFNKDFVKIILTPQLFLPLQLSPRPSFNTILFETKKPPVVSGEAMLESKYLSFHLDKLTTIQYANLEQEIANKIQQSPTLPLRPSHRHIIIAASRIPATCQSRGGGCLCSACVIMIDTGAPSYLHPLLPAFPDKTELWSSCLIFVWC